MIPFATCPGSPARRPSGSTERELFLASVRPDVAMLVRAGSLDDLPAMAAVFRRAVLANEGDRDLLFDHPDLTNLEPPADEDVVLGAEVAGGLVGSRPRGPLTKMHSR